MLLGRTRVHEVARTTSVAHMRGASALGRNHREEDESGVETASPTGGARPSVALVKRRKGGSSLTRV